MISQVITRTILIILTLLGLKGRIMKQAKAFAPGHLTGFFQICDENEDPLKKGARGAGVSLGLGVQTKVTIELSDNHSQTISFNGKRTNEAFVSESVLEKFKPLFTEPLDVNVEVTLEVPLGAGFGSSGCGALSLALALNEATGIGLSPIKAAQIAHVAEIECRTGLGSVFASFNGGFGVLYKPGAPGIGEAIKYLEDSNFVVVYLFFAPIPTKEALSDPKLRKRINEFGGCFVDCLQKELTPQKFMEFSRRFSEHVGLMTPRVRKVLKATDKAGFKCTMAMFGEVIFSLVNRDDAYDLATLFEKEAPGKKAVVVSVNKDGAGLI